MESNNHFRPVAHSARDRHGLRMAGKGEAMLLENHRSRLITSTCRRQHICNDYCPRAIFKCTPPTSNKANTSSPHPTTSVCSKLLNYHQSFHIGHHTMSRKSAGKRQKPAYNLDHDAFRACSNLVASFTVGSRTPPDFFMQGFVAQLMLEGGPSPSYGSSSSANHTTITKSRVA